MQCGEAQWVLRPDSSFPALHNGPQAVTGQEDQRQRCRMFAWWLESSRAAEAGAILAGGLKPQDCVCENSYQEDPESRAICPEGVTKPRRAI